MVDDRLDLSSLDPTVDEVGWKRLAASIHRQAAPELARRAARGGVLGVVGHWAWPMLAAASIVAVLSGGALALVRPPAVWEGVIQALDLSEPVSEWLEEGRPLNTDDLLLALEGGS